MLPFASTLVQHQLSQCFPHSESDLAYCARSFIIFTLFSYFFVCGIMGTKKTRAKYFFFIILGGLVMFAFTELERMKSISVNFSGEN